jgi:FMN phosphatase YigB (HAD superfamily)
MIKAIIFDWVGVLFARFKQPYPFSQSVLKQLKAKYKLGLVTLAGQGLESRMLAMKLKAPKELGCYTVWVHREHQEFWPNQQTGEPDKRIDSATELLTILKK